MINKVNRQPAEWEKIFAHSLFRFLDNSNLAEKMPDFVSFFEMTLPCILRQGGLSGCLLLLQGAYSSLLLWAWGCKIARKSWGWCWWECVGTWGLMSRQAEGHWGFSTCMVPGGLEAESHRLAWKPGVLVDQACRTLNGLDVVYVKSCIPRAWNPRGWAEHQSSTTLEQKTGFQKAGLRIPYVPKHMGYGFTR